MTVRPNLGLAGSGSNLIARVVPTKGEGSTYGIGEDIRVNVTVRDSGYVTLLALNSSGSADVLVRNAYVGRGTTTFPRPEDAVTFNAAAPRGLQRIRAVFTRPRPTTDLVLGGIYDGVRWNNVTNEYLSPYAPADRDVQETYVYIR